MTDPDMDALAHWSSFGQPGATGAARYVPTAEDLAKVKPFVLPRSNSWDYALDADQTTSLLRGSRAEQMEDKWNIWSGDVADAGATSVYFCRSWTGKLIVQVELRMTDAGSHVVGATWEMDPSAVKAPSEEFARETFEECCAWVLGMARPVAS